MDDNFYGKFVRQNDFDGWQSHSAAAPSEFVSPSNDLAALLNELAALPNESAKLPNDLLSLPNDSARRFCYRVFRHYRLTIK